MSILPFTGKYTLVWSSFIAQSTRPLFAPTSIASNVHFHMKRPPACVLRYRIENDVYENTFDAICLIYIVKHTDNTSPDCNEQVHSCRHQNRGCHQYKQCAMSRNFITKLCICVCVHNRNVILKHSYHLNRWILWLAQWIRAEAVMAVAGMVRPFVNTHDNKQAFVCHSTAYECERWHNYGNLLDRRWHSVCINIEHRILFDLSNAQQSYRFTHALKSNCSMCLAARAICRLIGWYSV